MRGNAIYRLDPTGSRFSIYGEGAECLHILGDWLYFISGHRWKKLSIIDFGEAEAV
jgi:hypothetical protein